MHYGIVCQTLKKLGATGLSNFGFELQQLKSLDPAIFPEQPVDLLQ